MSRAPAADDSFGPRAKYLGYPSHNTRQSEDQGTSDAPPQSSPRLRRRHEMGWVLRLESVGNGYIGHVSRDDPNTKETDAGAAGADDDVETDPAKDTETGSDWADEGGATPDSPATDADG